MINIRDVVIATVYGIVTCVAMNIYLKTIENNDADAVKLGYKHSIKDVIALSLVYFGGWAALIGAYQWKCSLDIALIIGYLILMSYTDIKTKSVYVGVSDKMFILGLFFNIISSDRIKLIGLLFGTAVMILILSLLKMLNSLGTGDLRMIFVLYIWQSIFIQTAIMVVLTELILALIFASLFNLGYILKPKEQRKLERKAFVPYLSSGVYIVILLIGIAGNLG